MGVSEFREGWVLVAAAFVVFFLVDGITFSFGLFLVAFLDEFEESRVSTAFAGSIGFGVQYVLGPISGSIADRFDSRPPIIIGTLISFAGYLASSFAKSIPVMCVSYGLLGGGYVMLFGVVLADEFGTERIGKSYGLNILTFGLSSCFAVPLAGWIFDVSNNYDIAFYVGGGECMMATMCLLAPKIWSFFNL